MNYDEPIHSTYTLAAATISSAATLLTIIGPVGKQGHLIGLGSVVTTGVTDAAALIEIGDGTTDDKYGLLSIPVSSAGAALNSATLSTNTLTQNSANLIAANTKVLVKTDGGATVGASDLFVMIDWF